MYTMAHTHTHTHGCDYVGVCMCRVPRGWVTIQYGLAAVHTQLCIKCNKYLLLVVMKLH